MAAAAVAVAHRKGLDVPGDVSIVGYDDTAMAVAVWPQLTTIRQPIATIARQTLDLIARGIRSRRSGTVVAPEDHIVAHALIRTKIGRRAERPDRSDAARLGGCAGKATPRGQRIGARRIVRSRDIGQTANGLAAKKGPSLPPDRTRKRGVTSLRGSPRTSARDTGDRHRIHDKPLCRCRPPTPRNACAS